MADDLTDADRDYARRYAAARGCRPHRARNGEWGWFRWYEPDDGNAPLPPTVLLYCGVTSGCWFGGEPAAWDALALALKRVRADAAIPGETWVRLVDAGPLQPLPDDDG